MTDVNPAPSGSASDDEEPDGTRARKEAESTLSPRQPDLQSRFYSTVWAPGWHSMCVGGGSARSDFETHSLIKDWRDVVENALPLRDMNVWFSRNGMNARPMRGRGGEKDIGTAKCIAVDLDWIAPGAHSDNEKLLTEDQTWTIVERFDIMPSWVVATGHGVQVYWCFGDVVEAKVADRMQRKLGVWLRGHGLHPERLDLSGVMRVPGTMNVKIADEPKPVTIEFEGPIYESSQLEALFPSLPEPAETPKPSAAAKMLGAAATDTGQTPAEWFVENCDYLGMLIADGWQEHSRRGDEVMLTRPGKEVADGKSAVLHLDGHQTLVIFSNAIANELRVADRMTTAGTVSLDAFEYLAAVKFRGAKTEAARHVRNLMPKREARVIETYDVKADAEANYANAYQLVNEMQPGDEFWDRYEFTRIVKEAADIRRCAPMAVLAALFTRRMANVSSVWRLPPIIGSPGSLNMVMAVIGDSGAGKSTGADLATELYPGHFLSMAQYGERPRSDAAMLLPFYEDERDEEKRMVRKSVHFGVQLEYRESEDLVGGTQDWAKTRMEYLRSMWSGEKLGGRIKGDAKNPPVPPLEPHSYRMTLLALMQFDLMPRLLDGKSLGTPQRWVFVPAARQGEVDTSFEAFKNRRSGIAPTLELAKLPPIVDAHPMFMQVDEVIEYEVWRDHEENKMHDLDRHHNLNRLKMAAAFSWCDRADGRITETDWEAATDLMNLSRRLRDLVMLYTSLTKTQEQVQRARTRAKIDHQIRSELEDQEASKYEERLRRYALMFAHKVREAEDGHLSFGRLRNLIKSTQRELFWPDASVRCEALDLAIEEGWLLHEPTERGNRCVPGPVEPPAP